jgi:hypothetical protein
MDMQTHWMFNRLNKLWTPNGKKYVLHFSQLLIKWLKQGGQQDTAQVKRGIAFEWTEFGLMRLKSLFELREDLSDESFVPERFKTLISIMRQEAYLQGWSKVL